MWTRYFLVPILFVLFADTTPAGIFTKKTKPDPAKYVPELIATLKSEKDEGKRADAASELREYDAKTFPEILPALVEALQNDPSSSVRVEAVNSLSKLRPITQQAGYALEQALANDSSIRVRMTARTTLWQYHLLGYRSGKPTEGADNQSKEPPLASPKNANPTAPQPQPKQPTTPVVPPQPKQANGPTAPKVAPPLLNVAPPLLPTSKTNPLATPTINGQSAEPPPAVPTKSVETPKPELKLNLPPAPPTLVISPNKPVEIKKPVETKPIEVKKAEDEGPILSPPKD